MIRFKLILTALFWGGTFIAGRVVARELEPFSAAFLRFAIASLFLLGITWQIEGTISGNKLAIVFSAGPSGNEWYCCL